MLFRFSVLLMFLLASLTATAQVVTRQDGDGVIHIIERLDKSQYPNVQDQRLVHIGAASQWATIGPKIGPTKVVPVVRVIDEKLGFAVFNFTQNGKVQVAIGLRTIDWKAGTSLRLALTLVEEAGKPVDIHVGELTIVLKSDEGAIWKPEISTDGPPQVFRVVLSSEGKPYSPVYLNLDKQGFKFIKRPTPG